MGRQSSEPRFRTFESCFLTAVEDALVVCLFGAQQVEDDARQLVRRRGNGLRFAELTRNAPEELSEIIFGVMQE